MPGFFSNTLAVLRREIHRVARQPMYWLLTVILPIVAFAFFAVLLYKGVARDIPIAVVDQDNSTLSRKVTQMIDATPTAWVAYGVQGMEEAERLMLQGKVMGIVLIPDFFEKNILNNSQTHLESYLTGTNITVNGLLAKDLQTTVTTFTAGIQLQLLMKQGLTEKQAMAQLMPVRFDKHVLFNPHINYGYYLSPSFMPMMLLIFTIMATIFVIGTELKNGTAREWYDTAGGSVFAAYAGKILPITVIMFLMSELMLLVIFKVVGVPLNGSLTVITISNLLFILSYQSLGAMIVTVLSNLRLSLSIGGGYSVLAFTFSGLTFPIMAMSKPMQWFCCIFPFTFYTDIMVDQALRGAPAIYSLPDMGIIALFIILPLLCLPRLRTICTNKKYWGEIIAMSRFTKQITSYWQQFRTVVRNEYGSIFTDAGVILVLVLALLIYSTLYSLAYGTQVLRNVPIGVIDMSNTSTSRQLINTFNAGPNVYVAYEPGDMDEAKHLFYDREIYGVVYIPSDYEEKLLGGQQAVVSLYVDASYFLMYRQAFQELVSGIGTTGAMVEFQRLIAKGANIPQATATTQPVIYQSHNLFNPYLGYGSFVMPAIIMVIIQQTMLIGIGMIGGTWSEFGLYKKLIPPGRRRMSTLPVVAGKAFVYASIYAVTLFYILGLHYKLFHFPTNGHTADIIAFLIPYLLSCIFLGIAVSTLFQRREQSIMLLLWCSIPALMLSGASVPREAMPEWLYRFGQILPSSSGVEGFIRLQSMGASFSDVLHEVRILWILTIVYGGFAAVGIHLRLKKAAGK